MYTLDLSQQEVQTIVTALGEMPLKISANVYGNIQRQIMEQDAASAMQLETGKENA